MIFAALCVLLHGCATIRPMEDAECVERPLVVTGYCKCGDCCDWHRSWGGIPVYSSGPSRGKRKAVGVTASGSLARHGTIAADPARYPFGTIMYVEGYGYGRVEDVGENIRGNHIDLYFNSHGRAEEWGKKTMRVRIWRASSAPHARAPLTNL